jgi:DNA-binding response OmpR family regulator
MASDPTRPRILLVEDDDDVRLTTSLVLESHGFTVLPTDGGQAALDLLAASGAPAAAVVDVAMPGIDGIRLTRLLRDRFDFPVLLLTARDLPSDVVTGLDAGADDYVTKPFDGDVLAARLRAMLRRDRLAVMEQSGAPECFGHVAVDRSARTVTSKGLRVALSATEFRVLEYLLDNSGRVMSRTQILQAVWGDAAWIDARVVDTNVARLRSKLDTQAIETVRGFGYKLVTT